MSKKIKYTEIILRYGVNGKNNRNKIAIEPVKHVNYEDVMNWLMKNNNVKEIKTIGIIEQTETVLLTRENVIDFKEYTLIGSETDRSKKYHNR